MKILAHRGYWDETVPNNTPEALRRALESGYGFESDLRDYAGELVISHNIATARSQKAEEVFRWLAEFQDQFCFAINIKADGLKELLLRELREYHIKNYFTFDMSVPQMIEYNECGVRFFTRRSEVETQTVMLDWAAGVWVDGFFDEEWITEELLQGYLDAGKEICIVSPELHGRPYLKFWDRLLGYSIHFDRMILCTDRPAEASKVFQGLIH